MRRSTEQAGGPRRSRRRGIPLRRRTRAAAGVAFPTGKLASVALVDLASADRAHLWHPFTQQQGWVEEEPLIVERAEGTDLIDADGRRYIDGVSSLWCNVHGHRHPRIDAAVRDQLDRVAHSTMLGLCHRPAHRAGAAAGGARAGRAHARLLLGLGLDRHRDRAEDGVPVLAPARRAADEPFVSPADGLPRRHDRLGVGRRHRPVPLAYRPLLFDTLQAEPGDASPHGARCSRSTTARSPP